METFKFIIGNSGVETITNATLRFYPSETVGVNGHVVSRGKDVLDENYELDHIDLGDIKPDDEITLLVYAGEYAGMEDAYIDIELTGDQDSETIRVFVTPSEGLGCEFHSDVENAQHSFGILTSYDTASDTVFDWESGREENLGLITTEVPTGLRSMTIEDRFIEIDSQVRVSIKADWPDVSYGMQIYLGDEFPIIYVSLYYDSETDSFIGVRSYEDSYLLTARPMCITIEYLPPPTHH